MKAKYVHKLAVRTHAGTLLLSSSFWIVQQSTTQYFHTPPSKFSSTHWSITNLIFKNITVQSAVTGPKSPDKFTKPCVSAPSGDVLNLKIIT